MSVPPEQVLQCLVHASTSLVAQERKSSEDLLRAHLSNEGFPKVLMDIYLAGAHPAARQLAGVLIKSITKSHWSEEEGKAIISDADKQALRDGLPKALFLEDSKLSTMAGVALGGIANHDFPEEWPTLVSDLVGVLAVERPPSVVAAVVKALRIIAEDLSEVTVHHYSDAAAACLCRIVADQGTAQSVRHNSLLALSDLIQESRVYIRKEGALSKNLRNSVTQIIPGLIGLLSDHSRSLLSCTSACFFTLLFATYPNWAKGTVPSLLPVLCTSLAALSEKSPEHVEEGYTSEGDAFGQYDVMLKQLHLLERIMHTKNVSDQVEKVLGLQNPERVAEVFKLLLKCSRLSDDDIEEYEAQPGGYLGEEDAAEEMRLSSSLRDISCAVAENIHKKTKGGVSVLLTLCRQALESSQQDWKGAEAGLFLLDSAFASPALLKSSGFSHEMVEGIARGVLQCNQPYLVARCLQVMTKSFKALKTKTLPQDIIEMIATFSRGGTSHVVRLVSLRCFIFAHHLGGDKSHVEAVVAATRQALASSRGDPKMTGDTLESYILDLSILVGQHPDVEVATLPFDAIQLWQAHHTNPFVVDSITTLFRELSGNPSAEPSIRQVIPFMMAALRSGSLPDDMVSSAVVIIGHICKKAGPDLLRLLVAESFPVLGALTMAQNATQAIAFCIRNMVTRVGGQALSSIEVASPTGGPPISALSLAMDVAQATLNPEFREVTLTQTGKFVLQLIDAAGPQLGMSRLGSLLGQVVDRVILAQSAVVCQELLLPVAALAVTRTDDVGNFLLQPQQEGGAPRLQLLLQQWLTMQPDFYTSTGELHLLLAGLTSLVAKAEGLGFPLRVDAPHAKKGGSVPIDIRLGGYVAVARSYAAAVNSREEGRETDLMSALYDFDSDDDDDEEDEECEEDDEGEDIEEGGEGDEAGGAAGSSDDDDSDCTEADFKMNNAILESIYGTQEGVRGKVKQYLQERMADLAPKSLPYITERDKRTLVQNLQK
eukprot:TRINITY_DN2840_c0_g3_i1.p1 TRINITY_DN2840_c0_g3~~TRINITY_DN2840_c0_g3_i1.p1  ORF type:complete len:997 (+),score=371.45 TRINITY_DN2840_c0_g3_i1:96-3086(+)